MSCERFREALSDAALGAASPELESHLPACEPCRGALVAERALFDRIDAELQGSLEIRPSLAFLPAARRRVAQLRARREAVRRRWLVPAMATLAGILVGGHFFGDASRGPEVAVSHPVRPVATRPVPAVERTVPQPRSAPEPASPSARKEPAVVPAQPRVFVPAEDERVVRCLARRLRGRAARAAVLVAETEGAFDFTLGPLEEPVGEVSLDDRVLRGAEPGLEEPGSFDHLVEEAGRDT